jgi:hypothetical protein
MNYVPLLISEVLLRHKKRLGHLFSSCYDKYYKSFVHIKYQTQTGKICRTIYRINFIQNDLTGVFGEFYTKNLIAFFLQDKYKNTKWPDMGSNFINFIEENLAGFFTRQI